MLLMSPFLSSDLQLPKKTLNTIAIEKEYKFLMIKGLVRVKLSVFGGINC